MNLPAFGTPAGEIVRALILGAGFLVIVALAEAWRRAASPPVEWTRKAIHTGCGLLLLVLPWWIAHVSTLAILTALALVALSVAKRARLLPSLFAVDRSSRGELFFPLAVLFLFAVARGTPVFYAISILTLVVCDALAAVLGRAYGAHPYQVTRERKSLEGSAVFLLTAFLAIELPLLLCTDLSRASAVMIAAQLALLLTAFEAISGGGYDNLVVPIATWYLLLKLTQNTALGIGIQLVAQCILLAAMLLLAKRTGFVTFSGALAAHLVLYAAFSLGGPTWTLAPALVLLGFVILDAVRRGDGAAPPAGWHVRALFHVCIVATAVLFADDALYWHGLPEWTGGRPLAALWVGTLAAPLALALEGRMGLARAGAIAWAFVAPLGLLAIRGGLRVEDLAVSALVVAFALAARRALRVGGDELRGTSAGVAVATLVVTPVALWLAGAFGARP